jgi:hypothetical protein
VFYSPYTPELNVQTTERVSGNGQVHWVKCGQYSLHVFTEKDEKISEGLSRMADSVTELTCTCPEGMTRGEWESALRRLSRFAAFHGM